MNFAAQFFFTRYMNKDSLQQRRFSHTEEYDPFWQRWENEEPKFQPPKEFLNLNISQNPLEAVRSASTDNVMAPECFSQPLSSSKDLIVRPQTLSPDALPPAGDSEQSAASSQNLPKTPEFAPSTETIPPQTPPAGLPSTVATEEAQPTSTAPHTALEIHVKSHAGTSLRSSPASTVSTNMAPCSLPRPASVPHTSQGPSFLARLTPSPQTLRDSESRTLMPGFHTMVCLLLHLFLSFILLFLPREEERNKLSPHDGQCNKDVPLRSETLTPHLDSICPEHLQDFGAEEYLTADMKTFETGVEGAAELPLTAPPKPSTMRIGEHMSNPGPPVELLRFEDISAAALKIQQSGILKTPCTFSRLSKLYGMEIYLKQEHLHYTGSVKERGVLCLLSSLKQEQQKKGVIVATDCTFSMAVAHHAAELRIPVFVILPTCSTPARLRVFQDYGAMVISYGSSAGDSQNHAYRLAKENSYLCLEEDDSAAYLAGLGTVGTEVHEQVPKLDAVVVPAGGQWGVLAGTAAAIKHLNPQIRVIGIESEKFPFLPQSHKTNAAIKGLNSIPNKKLCGDLVQHSLGTHTLRLTKKMVDKFISVREEDCLLAMLRFQEYEGTTVDIEGSMGLAAILSGQLSELKGKRVAVLVSSANMDFDLMRQCVERALVLDDHIIHFTVQLEPRNVASLLDILDQEDVRLLEVWHRRYSGRPDLFKIQVECVVESKDKTQSCHLRRTLSDRYPTLHWMER